MFAGEYAFGGAWKQAQVLESEGVEVIEGRVNLEKYVFLDKTTETRIYCGFRENMIQESTKPCNEVAFKWLG